MVEPAELDKEVFIVLTLDYDDLTPALKIQESIAEYYNLYEDGQYPELHITLDRINKDSIQQAKKILEKIAKDTQPVPIAISNFECFKLSNSLVLKVDETQALVKLANKIHNQLSTNGLSTIDDYVDWNFHITLVNNHFTDNKISDFEFNTLCSVLDGLESPISTTAKSIEIWQPTLNPEEKQVASFKL
ncbi:2'-5' RNA ligase family protein [Acetohalobium arabaticum]|uniref:A-kinase anchor protein 7-like phosphoesterase domain-containing protein n=1 Tax=Acetohalobium arabaticum (strain ATCC 49924 / DSM 5501 / Z-7288) TaxID=574087 RepID=D9QRM2_ACEAZ|nr:2'-5' RNA ligase family protein [Acetohalobium arabaticum]ADL13163.1 conserved hypothetical protein [Acetohalobium arabaticum DSM 5501]